MHTLPDYLPRRRGWQFALGEASVMMLALSAWFLIRFGHDALLVLRDDGGWRIVLVCMLCLLCLYGCDLYECPVLGDWREQWRRLPLAVGALALVLAGWQWIHPGLELGPRLALLSLAAAVVTVAGVRLTWRLYAQQLRPRQAAVMIGAGELAEALYGELHRHGELGWRLAGRLSAPQAESLRALGHGAGRGWARRLLAVFPGGWAGLDPGLRRQLESAGCRLEEGAEWYERLSGKVALPQLSATALVAGGAPAVLAAKRIGDAAIAAAALALCAPLLLLVGVLIRLDSPGGAIFRQRRVGRYGRPFTIYKFRTMFHNADAGGRARPAGEHDPRCTRLGRWLRRLRLDELPQLLNIVRGDMSLVGPRPFVPDQERECCDAIPGYEQRWRVLPGATGWAQVNRGYCASLEDNQEKLAYDLFYIKHLSLWFDVIILLQTLKVVCLGRGGR